MLYSLFSLFLVSNWVVYYSDKEDASRFLPYETIVFESDAHPSLQLLKVEGKNLLGYLSLNEVHETRPYFSDLKQEGLLLGEQKNWKGSYFIDIRDKRWQKRVIEELIPHILSQGFNGVFLDTLDDAEYLEPQYPGMIQAAKELVLKIRENYPGCKIMLNRAFYLLPQTARSIDMALAESLVASWSAKANAYELIDPKITRFQFDALKSARQINPQLKLYSLDYWDPNDPKMVKEIYRKQRSNGFYPYVSTHALDRVIDEP